MIVIGPGALLLLILLMFKPVRFLVGWGFCILALLFIFECVRIYLMHH
jgi:hypothetical protein